MGLEFKWSVRDAGELERRLPDLYVDNASYLSDCCGRRYPWLFYRTQWGKRWLDPKIVRVRLGEAV